ncbi:MFS transporter [Streptomyces sp. NPDC056486]|uniref:MFS transporter n=1 Tax=Streptomyces sp. NPDC056486 TaxID=3345835 RepID=UPI00369C1CB5
MSGSIELAQDADPADFADPADPAAFRGRRQPALFLPLFVFAYFGVALAGVSAPAVSIPLRLSELDPAHKTQTLSLTVALGGVLIVLVTAPLGRFSDVSTSRAGIRRPFILGGSLVGASGMLVLALAPNVAFVIAGWGVAQAGFAATSMALNALLADQIPTRIRARVAATFGLSTGIAPVIGSSLVGALPGNPLYWFGIPAAIALVASIGVVLVLRDIVRTEPVPVDWRSLLRSYWINPLRHKDFAWAWTCRLLVTISLVSVVTYLLYFLTDRLGIASDDAASKQGTVLGVFFAFSVVTTLVFGWISDRTGKRKTIVWCSALFTAVGLLISLFAHDLTTFAVGIALAGMGQGAFVSVDVAMMTELLPDSADAGTGLAVIALSYQLPNLLVPVLATLLLAIGDAGPNYVALFGAAVIASTLGALAVLPIKSVP